VRFEAGWLVHVPGHDFPSKFGDILNLARVGAYLTLKPAVIPAKIRGTTKFIGIPSGSIVTPSGNELGKSSMRSYVLADDAWLEVKPIGLPGAVEEGCPLSELVGTASLISGAGGCEVRCYRSIEDLDAGLNKRQVALVSFGDEFSASGILTYLWSTHPVLSGLGRREVSCKCWDPGYLGRLGYVSKPLVFIGDAVVAAEITHNRSFIFFCDCVEGARTLYLRAMMYSC